MSFLKYCLATGLLFITLQLSSQEVKWMSWEEAAAANDKQPKKIFVDVYTNWCGWCKKMDQETFTNNVIAEILNTRFYPVKFNAEGKESVTFLGQTFVNDGKSGRTHQLAIALLQGQLSYPTVVFLTKQDDQFSVSPVPGFRQPKDMEMLLSFFADQAYLSQKWEDYQRSFKGRIQ